MASRRFRIEFTVDMDCWNTNDIEAFAIQELTSMSPYPRDIEFSEVGWHTGTPTETGEYLVCIKYDFGEKGYTTANYVEPFNPHGGWYSLKPPSAVSAEEWCKKHGIEVIAWQKIEPYKEKETCFVE